MEPSSSTLDTVLLETLRRHRAELRESMGALEAALAAPAPADQGHWAGRVHAALAELAGDLREHIALTEGPDGFHHDVLEAAPRLSDAVATLTRDHLRVCRQLDDLLARVAAPGDTVGVDDIRDGSTTLLATLVRHRQRGSDLVFEAYSLDIGGET